MQSPHPGFSGFPESVLEFLQQLAANNDRDWFQAHREDFLRCLQQPFQDLVIALTPCMLAIDPEFEVTPKTDRTISRIYRDTRFSKDKSPYRATMWLTFKRPSEDWKEEPAYYFELRADGYSSGMGFFSAGRATMDALRQIMRRSPEDFRRAIAFMDTKPGFLIGGEKYARPLPEAPEGLEDWYQRKNLYLYTEREMGPRVSTPGLADDLAEQFETLAPLYHYLWIASERGRA